MPPRRRRFSVRPASAARPSAPVPAGADAWSSPHPAQSRSAPRRQKYTMQLFVQIADSSFLGTFQCFDEQKQRESSIGEFYTAMLNATTSIIDRHARLAEAECAHLR